MNPTFGKAAEMFEKELCSWKGQDGDMYPLPCQIHAVFTALHDKSHNCIGCNFASSVNAIRRVLRRISASEDFDPQFDCSDYLMSLYLFVERAHIVFDIISLPEGYRKRHFPTFQEVKRWANFLKHPNFFILVHHPEFQAGGVPDPAMNWEQVVDTDFVKEHYRHDAESRGSKLKAAFVKKTRVLVLFPDPITLTERFCSEVKHFVAVIEDNAVFREVLDDMATYEHYFESEPSGKQSTT